MNLLNRFTNAVLFSADVKTVQELLLEAIRAKADLCEVNLRGADLYTANLRGADLYKVNLSGANLCGANLCSANLCGANLCRAGLYGANLREANLRGADLREANLRGADLHHADLYHADLCGADLRAANLFGANAQINGHDVMQINGLPYPVLITDTHVHAGGQTHTFATWRGMSAEQIADMGGHKATNFYPTLIGIIDLLCKDRETLKAKDEEKK